MHLLFEAASEAVSQIPAAAAHDIEKFQLRCTHTAEERKTCGCRERQTRYAEAALLRCRGLVTNLADAFTMVSQRFQEGPIGESTTDGILQLGSALYGIADPASAMGDGNW